MPNDVHIEPQIGPQAMTHQLLLSSSRVGDSPYLAPAAPLIAQAIRAAAPQATDAVFVPFAAVGRAADDYLAAVAPVFAALDIRLVNLADVAMLDSASIIVVGGGNTFALVDRLQRSGAMAAIARRVAGGALYIGWSAGANVAGPTLCTTNDMPIVAPPSFDTLGLVPFQINPHFISGKPAGHNGESREERLAEYLALNPTQRVVALCEGSALWRRNDRLELVGDAPGQVFDAAGRQELAVGADLSAFL